MRKFTLAGKATRRYFAHHELTQDEIDCRLVNRIAIAQRGQPCPHFVDGMDITIKYLLLQWLCYLTIVDFLRTSANQASSFALGLTSVILIFLIFVSLNTIIRNSQL